MDKQQTIAAQFNDCINRRDIDGLAPLMTNDHTFIDSANHTVRGKKKALQAWKGFFASFPDYRNIFEDITSKENLVIITGHSACSDERLRGPALWTAKVEKDKIAEWRVYEDTAPNRGLLGLLRDHEAAGR